MGTELTTGNGKIDGNIDKPTAGTGNVTGGGSTSSTDTRGNGTGTGSGTGAGTGAGNGKTEEKGILQLVTVTEEQTAEDKRLERNRKRRERYQKEKAENGQSVKPRKVNKAKSNEVTVTSLTKEQLNNLIVSTSAVVASRPNCSHWLITEKEADSITTPLLKMIAESEKLEVIAKNSNQIALAIACITIFVPRLFVTMQMNKALPKKEKKTDARKEPIRPTENSNKESNIVNDGQPADSSSNDDYVLSWDD